MGNAMRTKKTLPEELVEDILLKLSIKSLLRCRCVCNSWYDFIKNPNFIKSHLIKNQNHNYIILVRRLHNSMTTLSFLDYESLRIIAPDLDVPFDRKSYLDICGPCNGLICISHNLNKIVLCNPSLREFEEIPLPRFTQARMCSSGLGFDSNRNNYKIVLFLCLYDFSCLDNPEKIQCLIYDVGIKTWREIEHEQGLDMSCIEPFSSPSGVLFNGTLHWIAMGKKNSPQYCKVRPFILSFNLNSEVFRCITLPNTDLENYIYSTPKKRPSLIDFNNSLAIFEFDQWDTSEGQFVEIWVLKQDGVAESWTKQFVVGPLMDLKRPLLVRKKELLYLEGGEDDDDEPERELISRSLDTDDAHYIDGYGDTFRVLVNQASLVSIK